jgi:hypothetical protein
VRRRLVVLVLALRVEGQVVLLEVVLSSQQCLVSAPWLLLQVVHWVVVQVAQVQQVLVLLE